MTLPSLRSSVMTLPRNAVWLSFLSIFPTMLSMHPITQGSRTDKRESQQCSATKLEKYTPGTKFRCTYINWHKERLGLMHRIVFFLFFLIAYPHLHSRTMVHVDAGVTGEWSTAKMTRLLKLSGFLIARLVVTTAFLTLAYRELGCLFLLSGSECTIRVSFGAWIFINL